ncbi:MAG: FxLYD domain-containing protein [Raoultibacter sp.]
MEGIAKKVSLLGCSAVLAMSLAGCASGGEDQDAQTDASTTEQNQSPSGSEQEAAKNEVVITESGWSVDEQGYIHYGVILENKGDQTAQFPVVAITGKDAAGTVVSSDEQTLMTILPGQTISWGGQAGKGTAPETVDFSVTVSEHNWVASDSDTNAEMFKIDATSAQDSGIGTLNFVGEITNLTDADLNSVAVNVILRDATGNIVAGYTSFVNNLTAGSTASFDVLGYGVPAYETFEVTAQPWS